MFQRNCKWDTPEQVYKRLLHTTTKGQSIMGMDVIGQKPKDKVGEYFRRNVWGWHPLWKYVEDVHPDLAQHVKDGHSNSGYGLKARNSAELAEKLYTDIQTGVAASYVKTRDEYLLGLPLEPCIHCDSKGIRTDDVGVKTGMPDRELSKEVQEITGRTHGYCNGCEGTGGRPAWETNYSLDVQDIEDFAVFLKHCGGFRIC